MNISTQLILDAIEYYKSLGYKLIDVPLVVDRDISQHTKPKGVPDLNHIEDKVYVASAEQSFLQLYKDHKLPKGKYMALTPCYRHEGILNDTHFSVFLKLELFMWGNNLSYRTLLNDAYDFMSKHVRVYENVTEDSFDLEVETLDGDFIEVGSYGVRKLPETFNKSYCFGTGIAEPRFSYAIANSI